jgi:hypothetical protein
MTLPLAHLGHYLWVFYVLPVLIVIAGILKTTMSDKHRARAAAAAGGDAENDGEEAKAGDAPPADGTGREAENENLARRPPSP